MEQWPSSQGKLERSLLGYGLGGITLVVCCFPRRRGAAVSGGVACPGSPDRSPLASSILARYFSFQALRGIAISGNSNVNMSTLLFFSQRVDSIGGGGGSDSPRPLILALARRTRPPARLPPTDGVSSSTQGEIKHNHLRAVNAAAAAYEYTHYHRLGRPQRYLLFIPRSNILVHIYPVHLHHRRRH